MTVNISKALGIGFALLLLTVSLSYSLSAVFNVNDVLHEVAAFQVESNRILTEQTQMPTDVPVQGSDVLHYLYRMHELGVDIQVDDLFFEQTTERVEIDFQRISVGHVYTLHVVRNTDGSPVALHFHSQ